MDKKLAEVRRLHEIAEEMAITDSVNRDFITTGISKNDSLKSSKKQKNMGRASL